MSSLNAGNNTGLQRGGSRNDRPIDVLWINLEAQRSALLRRAACLSPRELARADRMRGDLLRERHVGAHVFLRSVLADHLQYEPGELAFRKGKWGKPELDERDCPLQFSLAHSGALAVVAISDSGKVGVDIEYSGRSFPWSEIINQFLSPAEQADLKRPFHVSREALGRLWTKKEAVAKATGNGLTLDLRSLEFGISAEPGWHLVDVPDLKEAYWVNELPFPWPWYGAIAVERLPSTPVLPEIQVHEWATESLT